MVWLAALLMVILCSVLLWPLAVELLLLALVGVLWACSVIGHPFAWLEHALTSNRDLPLYWSDLFIWPLARRLKARRLTRARLIQASATAARMPAPPGD